MLMSVADVVCYLELCYCTRLAPSCCSVGQEQHTCPLVLLPYVFILTIFSIPYFGSSGPSGGDLGQWMQTSGTSGGNPLFCILSSIIRDAKFRFSLRGLLFKYS